MLKPQILIYIAVSVCLESVFARRQAHKDPVVGVTMLHTSSPPFPPGTFYVFQQDVRWLEQANIRWIPLFMDEPEEATRAKLQKLNGILLTGGGEKIYEE
jgi:hypothetical protein